LLNSFKGRKHKWYGRSPHKGEVDGFESLPTHQFTDTSGSNMTKQWWGLIHKDQCIELKELKAGDFAKMKIAYKNETEIDFVIEPFQAESFEDAKVWIVECMKSAVEDVDSIIEKIQKASKKSVDKKSKKV
jgi:hypothetical protein